MDHFTDYKGAIAVKRGSARKLADFATAAFAYAFNSNQPAVSVPPACIRCYNPKDSAVDFRMTEAGLVIWRCHACGIEGQISNWRETFWDLRSGTPTK